MEGYFDPHQKSQSLLELPLKVYASMATRAVKLSGVRNLYNKLRVGPIS